MIVKETINIQADWTLEMNVKTQKVKIAKGTDFETGSRYFNEGNYAEAAGDFLDRLNRRVQSFTNGVGYSVLEEGQDISQVLAEHFCHGLDGLQAGADRPAIPALKMLLGPGWGMITPEVAKTLFERPGPCPPQAFLPQDRELFLPCGRQVFPRIKPEILGPRQNILPFLSQLPMFSLPDTIDSLDHMRHQMVSVKDKLLFALRHVLPNRRQIGVPDPSL